MANLQSYTDGNELSTKENKCTSGILGCYASYPQYPQDRKPVLWITTVYMGVFCAIDLNYCDDFIIFMVEKMEENWYHIGCA